MSFVVNGKEHSKTISTSSYAASTNVVTTDPKSGDKVWIRCGTSNEVKGVHRTYFN